MKNKIMIATLLACSPLTVLAHNIQMGSSVPAVSVVKYGELIIDQKNVTYQNWNSQKMRGKVRIIQAIAGRSSAKEMNAPLMSAITAAHFPESSYQTTTIINQDDSIWGTGSFVKSSAEDSKKEFPWSSIVLDGNGNVAKTWSLKEESSAIIVQDKSGKVQFVKEGKLTSDEINQVIGLVHTLVQ